MSQILTNNFLTKCLVLLCVLRHRLVAGQTDQTDVTNPAAALQTTTLPATALQTTVASVTTTSDPSKCSTNSSSECLSEFLGFYGNGTQLNQSSRYQIQNGLQCPPNISTASKSCLTRIDLDSCTEVNTASKGSYSNFTRFALTCTAEGHIVPIAWDPDFCTSAELKNSIYKTTTAFCLFADVIVHNTTRKGSIDLTCRYVSNHSLSEEYLTVDASSMLKHWYHSKGCTTLPPTTTDIPLSPNPVNPASITAIVVLVCLGIVSILAAFFFWPKCHIKDPALLQKKKKKDEGLVNEGFDFGGAAGGGAQYNARKDQVAMKIPPTFGPSAA